jgi:hypothetical protein
LRINNVRAIVVKRPPDSPDTDYRLSYG